MNYFAFDQQPFEDNLPLSYKFEEIGIGYFLEGFLYLLAL